MTLLPIFRLPSSSIDVLKTCLSTSNLDFKEELSCDVFVMRENLIKREPDSKKEADAFVSGSTIQINGHIPFLRNQQEPTKNWNDSGAEVLVPTFLHLTNEANYQIHVSSCHWNVAIPINTGASTNMIQNLVENESQQIEQLSSVPRPYKNITLPITPLVTSFYLQVRRNSKCSSSNLGGITSNSSRQTCRYENFGTLQRPMLELPLGFGPAVEIIQEFLYFEKTPVYHGDQQKQNPITIASFDTSDTFQRHVATKFKSIISGSNEPSTSKDNYFPVNNEHETTVESILYKSSPLQPSTKHSLQCSNEQFDRFQTIYNQLQDERGRNDLRLTVLFVMAFFIFGVEFYSTLDKMFNTWRAPFKKMVNYILINLHYGDQSSNFLRHDIINFMVPASIILNRRTQRRKQRVEEFFDIFSRLLLFVSFRKKKILQLLSDLPKVCFHRFGLMKVAMRSKYENTIDKCVSWGAACFSPTKEERNIRAVCAGPSDEEKDAKDVLHVNGGNENFITCNQKRFMGNCLNTSLAVMDEIKKTREAVKVIHSKDENKVFFTAHRLKKTELSGQFSSAPDLNWIQSSTVKTAVTSKQTSKDNSRLGTFQISDRETKQNEKPPLSRALSNGNENENPQKDRIDSKNTENFDFTRTCCNKNKRYSVGRSGSSSLDLSSSSLEDEVTENKLYPEMEAQYRSIPNKTPNSTFNAKKQIMKISPPPETNESLHYSHFFIKDDSASSSKQLFGDKNSISNLLSKPPVVKAIEFVSSPEDICALNCDSFLRKLHISTEPTNTKDSNRRADSDSVIDDHAPTESDHSVRMDLKSQLKEDEDNGSYQRLDNASAAAAAAAAGGRKTRGTGSSLNLKKKTERCDISSEGNKEMKNKASPNLSREFEEFKGSTARSVTTPQCAMPTIDKLNPVMRSNIKQNDTPSTVSFTSAIKSTSNAITLLRKKREDKGGIETPSPVVQLQRRNAYDTKFGRDLSPSARIQQEFINRLAMQEKTKSESKNLKRSVIKKSKVNELVGKWSLNIASTHSVFEPDKDVESTMSNGTTIHSQDGSFSSELRSKVSTDSHIYTEGKSMTAKDKKRVKFTPKSETSLSPHFLDNFVESK